MSVATVSVSFCNKQLDFLLCVFVYYQNTQIRPLSSIPALLAGSSCRLLDCKIQSARVERKPVCITYYRGLLSCCPSGDGCVNGSSPAARCCCIFVWYSRMLLYVTFMCTPVGLTVKASQLGSTDAKREALLTVEYVNNPENGCFLSKRRVRMMCPRWRHVQ